MLAACVIGLSACGGSGGSGSASGDSRGGSLIVAAAASLQSAFSRYGGQLANAGQGPVRFSFAGSDQLAAQIELGVKPDLFASANLKLPNQLCERPGGEPVVFASNRLVLAVPTGASKINSIAELAKPGLTLAIGSQTAPIGSYTQTVLSRLPLGPEGILGGVLRDAHIALVVQTAGVVVALTFVAAPFHLRQAQSAFGAVETSLLDASRTLGVGEAGTFLKVAVPVALPGLMAGLALAWGRALGEFGATLISPSALREKQHGRLPDR